MVRAVLVTCNRWPALSDSDRLYAEALTARGIDVGAAPWNGPRTPFAGADVIVLRSNWDYHHDPDAFVAWLADVGQTGALLFNPASLVLWNVDKRYLLDLAGKGVPIPVTRVADPSATAAFAIMHDLGRDRAVIKPCIGASGTNVELVDRATAAAVLGAAGDGTGARPLLVQEFMAEVQQSGEGA